MADELLRTKLIPPPGHVDLIERERLNPRMAEGLKLPLTLIVAPAGAGKTSLVRSWRSSEHGHNTLLAWVALDENDNDPVRFWRYVIAALETVVPGIGETARPYLDAAQQAAIQPALVSLINRLAESSEHIILALDDYHVIASPDIHESLTFFVENLPSSLRMLLISRADPPLPLARWRARGQMLEIRNADLRFTEEEARELLRTELERELNPAQIATLNTRTEGWAAGLHLAALALRGRDDADAFLRSFTGSHHFVLTYLAEDVLERQPAELQNFLLNTSILTQLTGELCDALTGRSNGGEVLRELATINLFTMALDDEGRWYRYHQLFAGVLQHQLNQRHPDTIKELHRRAADWYAQQGFITEAIDHAFKGDAPELAATLIQSTARATLSRGEAKLVQRWIQSLPEATLDSNARLLMAQAWSQMLTGPVSDVEPWILRAETARQVDPSFADDDFRGEAAALRTVVYSFLGQTQETIAHAQEARKHLSERDLTLRGIVAMSLGQAYRFNGDGKEAEAAYREAVELGTKINNLFIMMDSMADLGIVLMRLGRLREAHAVMERADAIIRERNATDLPVAGAIATIWPEILYEMHEPEKSIELAKRGLELGLQGAKTDLILNGHRSLGMAYWTLGDWDRALEELESAAEASRSYGLIHTTRAIETQIAYMHLTRGDLNLAQDWAASYRPDPDMPGFTHEIEQLMLARVCIASGDPGSALRILEPLEQPARDRGQIRSVMPVLNLKAIALHALGQQEKALELLSESLGYAAPEGYIQLFLSEGPAMSTLLRLAVARNIKAPFARRLLEIFDDDNPSPVAARVNEQLIEPLSDREQAVLRLMSAGLNAPEIAGELYVAPSTVRTHLKNIYRKLDVHSRDQAITRARELDLV